MISKPFADRFAHEWADAWNSRDLDRILAHYAEDVEMASPFIAAIAGEPSGILKGRAAVGAYWRRALDANPDLSFHILGVFAGASGVTVRYKSIRGVIACETFEFDAAGKVRRAMAHYQELDLARAAAHETPVFASGVTPILNVSDVDASLAWFGKFGWRTCWTWSADGQGPPTFAAVAAGEAQVFLCKDGQGGRGRGPNRITGGGPGEDDTMDKGVWMSVWVPDVDAIHARCLAEGLDITHPPTNEPWGVREMHLRHPDGHVFRLSAPTPSPSPTPR